MSRFLDRMAKKTSANTHGRVSEKKAMKALGATLTPGSGALPSAKSDGYDSQFQYENKSTVHKSYSLKLSVFAKIRKEALDVQRHPVLTLSFVTGSGVSVPDGDFVIISRDLFDSLRYGDLI